MSTKGVIVYISLEFDTNELISLLTETLPLCTRHVDDMVGLDIAHCGDNV